MSGQAALPLIDVYPSEVARCQSLCESIALCARVGGLEPKQIAAELASDKAQWSRWVGDKEGVSWPKFSLLMAAAGNDIPLLWMAHACGYDIAAMRKRETEIERQNRLLREEVAALRRVLQGGGA